MGEQTIKKLLPEEVVNNNFDNDAKTNALGFIAYLRSNKMPPVKNTEYSYYKGQRICKLQIGGAECKKNSWAVCLLFYYMDNYTNQILSEGLQNVIWNSIVFCASGIGCSPNKPCAGGMSRTILGKELHSVCRYSPSRSIKIWNPGETTVADIIKLLEFEKTARDNAPPDELKKKGCIERSSEPNPMYTTEKNVRREIGEVAGLFLNGGRLEDLTAFIEWIKSNKLQLSWSNWFGWSVTSKSKKICSILVEGYGYNACSWRIVFNYDRLDDESLLSDERLKKIVWRNIKPCNNCCGCGVKQRRTVFGKELENPCSLDFWNPEPIEIECAKQLILAKRRI